MSTVFSSFYAYFKKRKILFFSGILILFLGLGFTASQLEFEEDITKLIPTSENNATLQKVLQNVNFTDKIIVNIQREPDGSVTDLTEYATLLVDSLQKNASEFIVNIEGTVQDEDMLTTLNFVYDNLPLFLSDEDYNEIAEKISKDSIQKLTAANYKSLVSPSGIIAKQQLLKDPLGLSFLGLKKLQKLGVGDQFTVTNGFLVTKDGHNLLLFISPRFDTGQTAENEPFSKLLFQLQDNLNQQYTGKAKSEYFGGVLVAVANAQQIKTDIQFTVGIAFIVLLLGFIFFYRKLTLPLILFIPTLFGALLAMTVLLLVRSQISAISLGIGSVLLGITLDYSLHILTHIRNQHSDSLYKDIAQPILMSSLTTALAFLCLLFVHSQALQDLGIYAAVSVMGASVFALLFIPLTYSTKNASFIKSTWLDRLAAFPFHKNKLLWVLIPLLLIVSIFTYNSVGFNKDISKLNYEPTQLMEARNHLDSLTHINAKSIYITAFGETPETALRADDVAFKEIELLREKGLIESYTAPGALVFSDSLQQKKIEKWKQFWGDSIAKNTQNLIQESGSEFGFKPETFSAFYQLLQKDFKSIPIEEYKKLQTLPLTDFITSEENFTTVASLVKTSEENAEIVKKQFLEKTNILPIDRREISETLLGSLKDDFNKLIGYSLLVVVLILLLFYRSFSLTLVTAIPIALTWITTIGIMGFLKMEFNIFNIIISTFIFGIGIDYSIFITNGLLAKYRTGKEMLVTYKTSILLSLLTTILGIGILIFAKHPALYSISAVSLIGMLSAVLFAFTAQPLLFKLFIGSQTKRPITLRLFLHSIVSFGYYGLGGLLLSFYSITVMKVLPISKKVKMRGFHKTISVFVKSVLYTNPFVSKKIINKQNETFTKPAIIIANHTSFLDTLTVGMLHPNMIFLVNDWVYKSPIFGKIVQNAGFYPVSEGLENGVEHLREKVRQGYCLMAFPEGTRSYTHNIRRFHKGAFFLSKELGIDILPVLIHGNSEVLSKGTFIIKDGSITVKILPRISVEENNFGATYRELTKNVSTYFKREFKSLRNEIEGPTYFHNMVKETYRYMGASAYHRVKNKLKEHSHFYFEALKMIGNKESVLQISEEIEPLATLLMYDEPTRNVTVFSENVDANTILQNTFTVTQYSKFKVSKNKTEAFQTLAENLIIDTADFENIPWEAYVLQHFPKLIIFTTHTPEIADNGINLKYETVLKDNNLSIFQRKGDD